MPLYSPVLPPMLALNLQIYYKKNFFVVFKVHLATLQKRAGFLCSSKESLGSEIHGPIHRDGAMAQRKVAVKQGVREEEEAEK